MSYLGNEPQFTQYPSKFFNGDGTAMTVTLDYSPPNAAALLVFIDGVRQDTSAYTLSGTSMTFTGTVPSGTNNVQVVHLGLTQDVGVPSDDTITSAKIVDGTIVNADINASAAIADTKISLGTAIQAYDADTAKTDVSQTWSATQNFADQIVQRPEMKDYAETVYAGGNTSTAVTLDETNGNVQTFTMTGNCTFTMPSGAGLQAGTSLTLILTQDGTGSRTGAFTSVKWAGGTAPTLTTTATTGVDIITFYTFNGGASPIWYGFAAGLDMQ